MMWSSFSFKSILIEYIEFTHNIVWDSIKGKNGLFKCQLQSTFTHHEQDLFELCSVVRAFTTIYHNL